jgi:glutamyl-tRNA synthetase
MSVRVRYAPSPTGLQHIGSVRTALFNYFFARSEGGSFLLRVEDTDRERYSDEALQDLYDTFDWLSIEWDEGPDTGGKYGPYVQSERFELYQRYAARLLESGHAYRCYCTPERLEEVRKEQQKSKSKHQGYDRHCRNLSESEWKELEKKGTPSVVRFKVPLEGETEFQDILLGRVKRKNEDINPDPVLLKRDGYPTYHLANVVDDHLMEITHILRAQEWLSSGPLHVLLYEAFGWNPPRYCHLPMVLGKDGQKLSKRHGSTSVREFREKGYLPEALINYVTLIGWSYDDSREFFTKEELEELFTPDKLTKSPGVFDYKKLEWYNGQYIRQKSDGELKALILPYLKGEGIVSDPVTADEESILDGMMPLVKERIRLLSEAPETCRFLFEEVEIGDPDELVPKKLDEKGTLQALEAARELLDGFAERSDEENEELFRAKAEELDMKLGSLLMPLRIAVTGSSASPPLFGSIRLLGVDEAQVRVDRAMQIMKKKVG